MIRHVVLFRFKSNISTDAISDFLSAAEALKTKIPMIIEVAHGENFSERSQGYTHVVTMSFADRDALASFYENAAHKALKANIIDPIVEAMLISDYAEIITSVPAPTDGAHERAA